MSGAALSLVVMASAIHATWNLLTKRSQDRLVFLWLGLGAGLVLYLPAAAYALWRYPPDAVGWVFVVASGIIHAGYYWSLSRMYQYDFSLTYPMARGSAPVLVAVASLLFLREPLTGWGLGGVALVVGGIALLQVRYQPGQGMRWPLLEAFRGPAGQAACVTALLISSYSLVDKFGVRHINPIAYLWLSHLVAFVGYSRWMLRQRERIAAEAGRSRRDVVIVAIGQNLAYILVLFAMRLAPVAYVVPAREMSTMIGVMFGVLLLREPFPASKLGGAALIVAGVAMIALRG